MRNRESRYFYRCSSFRLHEAGDGGIILAYVLFLATIERCAGVARHATCPEALPGIAAESSLEHVETDERVINL